MLKNWQLPTLRASIREGIQTLFDQKTKPLGSLGRLEELAAQLGTIQDSLDPRIDRPVLLLCAGDHGVASQHPVSPYPVSVTAAMLQNLAAGGAAASVLSRKLGWELVLVDSGTLAAHVPAGVYDCRLGPGTRDFCREPAMERGAYQRALERGAALVTNLHQGGANLLALGEMGIGNSAAAAMLIQALCNRPIAEVVSRGAGCNDRELAEKTRVLEEALKRHGPITDPEQLLETYAGFEMVMLAGAMLEAASKRIPLLIDGLIVSSVALVLCRAQPRFQDFCIFAHRSAARGHAELLDQLGVRPLFDLGMRLGEGSGAALALPLLQSAVALLRDMATFESAAVASRVDV